MGHADFTWVTIIQALALMTQSCSVSCSSRSSTDNSWTITRAQVSFCSRADSTWAKIPSSTPATPVRKPCLKARIPSFSLRHQQVAAHCCGCGSRCQSCSWSWSSQAVPATSKDRRRPLSTRTTITLTMWQKDLTCLITESTVPRSATTENLQRPSTKMRRRSTESQINQ